MEGGAPLRYRPAARSLMASLSPFDCVLHQVVYSGADILLVSDGELPDPPLDAPTHARLRRLQREQGFEVRACCLPADGLLMAC